MLNYYNNTEIPFLLSIGDDVIDITEDKYIKPIKEEVVKSKNGVTTVVNLVDMDAMSIFSHYDMVFVNEATYIALATMKFEHMDKIYMAYINYDNSNEIYICGILRQFAVL